MPPAVGRPRKDPALILRDRYWAMRLKHSLPNESLASIERQLVPHLSITRRADGEGFSQPFALSKIAKGQRGISPSLDGVPPLVQRAERLAPGSIHAFRSVLWRALADSSRLDDTPPIHDIVCGEVLRRLGDRHFMNPSRGVQKLNYRGVLRAGRLAHRDALGLLLMHCSPLAAISTASFAAEQSVWHTMYRACDQDPALDGIQDALAALIDARFPGLLKKYASRRSLVFPVRRTSSVAVGIAMLLSQK